MVLELGGNDAAIVCHALLAPGVRGKLVAGWSDRRALRSFVRRLLRRRSRA